MHENRPVNPTGEGQPRDFLFVQSTTEIGGAESTLLNLFTHSAELRRRSLIVTLGFGEGDLPTKLRAAGADVVEIRGGRLRSPRAVGQTLLALRKLVRARGIKVVVGNGAHPQVFGGLAARLSGAKSVFLVNMIHAHPLWKNHPLDALAIRGPCDLLLAISRASQATLARLRPNVECRLLHWGTPIVEVPPLEGQGARAELGVGDEEVLLGSFGRLQRWKGQDVFVAAAVEVARLRPATKFVVVGGSVFGLEPEFFEELKTRAKTGGIADRVRFTGFRSDVPRLMAACDVVCHTTRVPEPFGLVIVEAMAQGRPVIATRGGGPSEIIESDADGLLVNPDDPQALVGAMIALIDDPARRRSMGRSAQALARARFSIDVMAEGLLRHLDGLR
jgi:glycosyltransferase involved in cell wall biosynthesis